MQILAFLDPDFLFLLFLSLWPFWLLTYAMGFVSHWLLAKWLRRIKK